ncbi:putative bifunctional diguanylate cyclase/phosphodiesterase [Yoonia sp. R2331]|uniref:putative bifunctional diguanylate cyclase/phosphodiesterase n=1 Tax=Yoonia sp. R2331 TaxID=3237238 RepID=UPI0034E56E6C
MEKRARDIPPEGLWKRYVAGMVLVVLLILSAHQANKTTIEQGLVDARVINSSGKMRMLTQRILLLSVELANDANPDVSLDDLAHAISTFDATHHTLSTDATLSPRMRAAYFDAPLHVDARVRLFSAAARGIYVSLEQSVAVGPALNTLLSLGHDGLLRDLDQMVTMFVVEAQQARETLRVQQTIILGGAIMVIILQAMFIYAPAHLTVTSTIRALRQNGQTLMQNQVKLRQSHAALERAATHDALTQLPNRTFLVGQIAREIRNQNPSFSLLHLDVDRFRAINEIAGEETGDAVLLFVRDVLQHCAREHDCVARTGGDEFMILTDANPDDLIHKIQRDVAHPANLSGRRIEVGLTIGHATATPDVTDPLGIISHAELALKTAKKQGRGAVQAFAQDLKDARNQRDRLAAELPNALRSGQIVPFFQPQIALADGTLAGVEVLARWQHPEHGIVPPDVFLPLAAAEGLSRELDQMVWSKAMQQFQPWATGEIAIPRLSLNAAPETIADPRVVTNLLVDMNAYGLQPEHVAIEVLETTLISSIDDTAAINIDRLIGAGITVELDDFGTGYASLSKLIQLDLSGIKLDRSLIQPLPQKDAESIVRAMLAIANEMAMHVVAEGVETDAQLSYLRASGCDIGQGYGIGRPMVANDFTNWAADYLRQSRGKLSPAKLRA